LSRALAPFLRSEAHRMDHTITIRVHERGGL
jgi:hypothetical protein